ncbi:MAG: SDR family oxidoreductase [Bacteroidota bacterium]
MRFENHTVVITGAGGAIGSSLTRAFVEEGAKVVLLGRTLESLEEVSNACKEGVTLPLSCDVLNPQDLQQVADQILDWTGRINVLVNAAGGNMPGATIPDDKSIFDLQIPDFQRVLNLNLNGTVLPSLVFGKIMVQAGQGVILNISSMAADRVLTRVAGYSASKAAMENFTRWMAVELSTKFGEQFRVNALAPGFFIGNQNRRLLTQEDGSFTERGASIIQHTPMKRFGEITELNEAALFLCSKGASFITGTVLPVDGGFSAFSGV